MLGDQTIILEVTGQKRGVKLGKIQKVERHVEDYNDSIDVEQETVNRLIGYKESFRPQEL